MNPNDTSRPKDNERTPPEARDSRLDSFVRQAAPILASERGLNEKSRLKLQILADQLHLPKDLYERALFELNQRHAGAQLSRTERQFTTFLAKELEKLSSHILTAQVEAKAIEVGTTKYQLGTERARELIRQQATEMAFERVSLTDAERHLEKMCAELLALSKTFSQEQMARILEFGAFWGLGPSQCEAIAQRVSSSLLQKSQRRRENTIILRWAVGLAALSVLVFAWLVVVRGRFNSVEHLAENDDLAALTRSDRVLQPAAWWPDELYRQVVQSADSNPDLNDEFAAAASAKSGMRQGSYLAMVEATAATNSTGRLPPAKLVAGLLDVEPDAQVLENVVSDLGEKLGPGKSAEMISPNSVAAAERASAILLALWHISSSPETRRRVEDLLFRAYTVSLDSRTQPGEAESRIGDALGAVFWNQLIEGATNHPRESIRSFDFLIKLPLSAETRSLKRDYLFAVLRSDPNLWRHLESAIANQIAEDSTANLIAWVESTEYEREPGLAEFVWKAIAARLGVTLVDGSPDATKDLLRRTLSPPTARNSEFEKRWNILRERESALKGQLTSDVANPPRLIYDAALLASLALRLDAADSSSDSELIQFDEKLAKGFDEWREAVSPFAETSKGSPRLSKPATEIERQQRDRAMERLRDPSINGEQKLQALASLSEIGDRFEDITYSDAAAIASFMLAGTEPDALLDVENCARKIRHWPNVVLALADQLPTTEANSNHAFTIFAVVLGEPARINPQSGWKNELRALALKAAADRIDETVRRSTVGEAGQWRQLEHVLKQLIAWRETTPPNDGSDVSVPNRPDDSLAESQIQLIHEVVAQQATEEARAIRRIALLIQRRFPPGLARTVFLEELLARAVRAKTGTTWEENVKVPAVIRTNLVQRLFAAEVDIAECILARHGGGSR